MTDPVPAIEPPSTALAALAGQLAHAECAPHVVAHCERSYGFARLMAQVEGVDVDDEVLYLGVILHDLGLAPRFFSSARFEVGGANVARSLLLDHGLERDRAEAVWDIVALHASTELAKHKSPMTRMANAGISLDVRGVGAERLPPEAVRSILDRFPRNGFPTAFLATLVDEVRRNPSAARLSWMEGMACAYIDGYQPGDFPAGLLASEHFR